MLKVHGRLSSNIHGDGMRLPRVLWLKCLPPLPRVAASRRRGFCPRLRVWWPCVVQLLRTIRFFLTKRKDAVAQWCRNVQSAAIHHDKDVRMRPAPRSSSVMMGPSSARSWSVVRAYYDIIVHVLLLPDGD